MGLAVAFVASAAAATPPRASTGLSANEGLLFQVSEDGDTILSCAAPGPPITCRPFPVPDAPFKAISALHATERYVYAASYDRVYRVSIDSRQSELLHAGEPLHDTAALTVAGDDLYVLDRSPAKLFRLSLSRRGELRELPIPPDVLSSGNLEMAGDGPFVYLVVPEARRIIEVTANRARLLPLEPPESDRQVVGESAAADRGRPKTGASVPPSRLAPRKPTALSRPTHIAAYRGIIYVYDDEAKMLVAFGRTDPRPLPLLLDGHATYDLMALAVDRQGIFVRHADGELRAYPRLVPVEVTLDTTQQSEVATQLYTYLRGKGLLPTRQVSIEGSFAATLDAQDVLPKGYVEEFGALACEINGGNPCFIKDTVPAGKKVLVPDVYSERFIDVREVSVFGRSVGETADAAIQTAVFKDWASEDVLARFNKSAVQPNAGHVRPQSIRVQTSGTFQLPSEHVRFLISMPADEVPPNPSALMEIRRKTPGVTFYSRESVHTVRAEAARSLAAEPDCAELRRAFEQMLRTIHYPDADPNQSVREVTIGVAEDDIDRRHWDWESDDAFLTPIDPQSVLGPSPATIEPDCRIRFAEPRDHGTAVAALMAARRTKFGTKGIASSAVMFPIPRDSGSIAGQIERAFIDNDVRTISMSLTYEYPGPAQLLSQMKLRKGTVLFVIAAGNDHAREAKLCEVDRRYPVCWGNELENVLIVTGTTLDGESIPAYANRNDDATAYVEIAAPAEGYFVAGQGNDYVQVAGTSFATPLVAATAALLYAHTGAAPRLIKQRLLATTDLLPDTVARSVGAGLLNVGRALREPRHTVIVKGGDLKTIQPIQSDEIRITLTSGETKPLRISQIQRVQKYENEYRYRVAYVDEGDPAKLLWQSPVSFTRPTDSLFRYRVVGDGHVVRGDLVQLTDFIGPMR
jgi:subtilisin family serine protease